MDEHALNPTRDGLLLASGRKSTVLPLLGEGIIITLKEKEQIRLINHKGPIRDTIE